MIRKFKNNTQIGATLNKVIDTANRDSLRSKQIRKAIGGESPELGIVFADVMITEVLPTVGMLRVKMMAEFETMLEAETIDVYCLDSGNTASFVSLGNDSYSSNQFSMFDGTLASWQVATIVTIRKKAKMNLGQKEFYWVCHSPRFFVGVSAIYENPEE